MGPTTYALCKEPVIGLLMWITSLCAFPNLFEDVAIPLEAEGAKVTASFVAPVTKRYQVALKFSFPSTDSRLKDEILGSRHTFHCRRVSDEGLSYETLSPAERDGLGRPIPFRVRIKKKDGMVVVDRTFVSLCTFGHRENLKWRHIGWVDLDEGEYAAEIISLVAQKGMEGIDATVSLGPGGHGK